MAVPFSRSPALSLAPSRHPCACVLTRPRPPQFLQGYPSCPRGAAVLAAGPNGEEMRALLRSGGAGNGGSGGAGNGGDLEAGQGAGGGQPCRHGCAHDHGDRGHSQRGGGGGEAAAAAAAAREAGAAGGGGGGDGERLRQQLRDIGFDD